MATHKFPELVENIPDVTDKEIEALLDAAFPEEPTVKVPVLILDRRFDIWVPVRS